ncbi:putative cytochrome p450 [Rosellinia necatrix]|uniref:Putative cytochrome p450 n=1 Tax=Rosellinia necatrix TaxID=77044 RepID=A0A1W2TPL0_ROSNE|nr:putative cytochrome p450 [Rosellinia necatrix]
MLARIFFPLFVSLASAGIAKRAIKTDVNIYAYGVGINGFEVYADSNSAAVIADNATAVANGLSNITWAIDTTGQAPWNVTATNSSAIGQFYIVPSSDEHQAVGFNSTPPTGAATVGFVVYGRTVEYATDTTYESQFYARNSTTGIYSLMWNSNSSTVGDGIPVVLKTVAPLLLDDI